MNKIMTTLAGLTLAGSAMASDFQVAISTNGKGALNEYSATSKGISLLGSYGPASAIYNSGLDGCPTTVVGASDIVATADGSLTTAIYQPCGARAEIVQFGVTNHGLYERYRAVTQIGGLGEHNPQYRSMSFGAYNSLTLIENTPEGYGDGAAVLYDSELRELAQVNSLSASDIVTAKIDSSGTFIIVCRDDGTLLLDVFNAKSNVLLYAQPAYPVPFKQTYTTTDPVEYAAFCQ